MARQEVDIGVEGNDGTGDSIRESFRKVNENFQELYAIFGIGGEISILSLSDTPQSFDGDAGKLLAVKQNTLGIEHIELASDSALNGDLEDTIQFNYSVDGKLVVTTTFRRIRDDKSPELGSHMNANNYAIGKVAVSQEAAQSLSAQFEEEITLEDLVVNKRFSEENYLKRGVPGATANVRNEPADTTEYVFTINGYNITNATVNIPSHGLDSSSNGAAYVYSSSGDDANNLTSDSVYYVRILTPDSISLHLTSSDALTNNSPLLISGGSGTQTLTDLAYNNTLLGNWLDNEVLPRKSVVRRQGDRMDGPLYLSDHPFPLSGINMTDDALEAASKFYVDSGGYATSINLFVNTQGDDLQLNSPPGREGRTQGTAFASVNAACQKAEELQLASPYESGPYKQTITYGFSLDLEDKSQAGPSLIQVAEVKNQILANQGVRAILNANKEFIQSEVIAYLDFTYPDFDYDREVCYRDIGLIIDSIILDVLSGNNANYLSRWAGIRYYSNPSATTAITSQKEETIAGINHAKAITAILLNNNNLDPENQSYVDYEPFQQEVQLQIAIGQVAGLSSIQAVNAKFEVIKTTIENGPLDAPNIVDGSVYQLVIGNGGFGFVDQGDGNNTDILPGKLITGKQSGAKGIIINYIAGNDGVIPGADVLELQLVEPIEFIVGEELEYGNTVRENQITILVEAGIYYEDYPIKVPINTSIKGDEFRRTIIRPKNRLSQSRWSNTYFYRDKEFDGLTGDASSVTGFPDNNLPVNGTPYLNPIETYQTGVDVIDGYFGYHYLQDPTAPKNIGVAPSNANKKKSVFAAELIFQNKEFIVEEFIAYLNTTFTEFSYNESDYRSNISSIVDALIFDLLNGGREKSIEAQVLFFSTIGGSSAELLQTFLELKEIIVNILQNDSSSAYVKKNQVVDQVFDTSITAEDGSTNTINGLVDLIALSVQTDFRPAKNNTEVDVFLMNDATRLSNITVQGHGGFMTVLDPDGQILTKSPYIQVGSSFSQSLNRQAFRGGMFVDAFCGNIPMVVESVTDPFTLNVRSNEDEGLAYKKPQTPAPFYIDGARFQVNAVREWDPAARTAILILDKNSNDTIGFTGTTNTLLGVDLTSLPLPITVQTAGNRSMLGNDFTQVNDLGYGLITTNAALSEMVSMFTYYTHASFYANNGGEIRSLNGSNAYGDFGLVAEGADPNEIPDEVSLRDNMVMPLKTFESPYILQFSTASTITLYAGNVLTQANTGATGTVIFDVNGSGYGKVYLTNVSGTFNTNDAITVTQGTADNIASTPLTSTTPILAIATQATNREEQLSIHVFDGDHPIQNRGEIEVYHANSIPDLIGRYEVANYQKENNYIVGGFFEVPATGGSGSGATFDIGAIRTGPTYRIYNISDGGLGYAQGNVLTISGTLVAANDNPVQTDVTITVDEVSDTGAIIRASVTSGVPILTASAPKFNGQVYKLNFSTGTGGFSNDGLISDLGANIIGTYRHNGEFVLKDVVRVQDLVIRPSTAIIFDEDKDQTYRSISFSNQDEDGNDLISDQVRAGFDINYDYVRLLVNVNNIDNTDINYINGGTTLGNSVGDRAIAVFPIDDQNELSRLTNSDPRPFTDMIFSWGGKIHRITNIIRSSQFEPPEEFDVVQFEDITYHDINSPVTTTGLSSPVVLGNNSVTLRVGLQKDSLATITINISTCRATGHDFLDIGTGGFNTSNYPNVILGNPAENLASFYSNADNAIKAQVWERTKGRVFWVSTDQDGFFRVGKFFTVDQGTGSVTFAASIALSNLDGLGFKRGVVISEFSTDSAMSNNATDTVPVQSAIRSYVNRRLGFNHFGATISDLIGPGVLPSDGSRPMSGSINMASNRITNLLTPISASDVANKGYVDDRILSKSSFDTLDNALTDNVSGQLSDVEPAQLLLMTGKKRLTVDADSISNGPFAAGQEFTTDVTSRTGTITQVIEKADFILGNIVVIVYEDTTEAAGTINTQDTISVINGGASAAVLIAPVDEIANGINDTNSDIALTVNRTETDATLKISYKNGSIVNNDISDTAQIAQSKLSMNAATTRANATEITQSDLGLASFDSDDFEVTGGWVTLKSNGVDLNDLPQLANNTVIGNVSGSVATPSAVGVTTTGEASKILRTQSDGSIRVNSLRLGGANTYEVLSLNETTLQVKTPGQAVILTAQGTTANKITVNIPGNISVGEANVVEGALQNDNTTYNGESRVSVDWIYSKVIQDIDTKGVANGDIATNGISIGENAPYAGVGTVTVFVTAGAENNETAVPLKISKAGLISDTNETYDIRSSTIKYRDLYVRNISSNDLSVAGNLTVNGNVTLGDASTDTITANASISPTAEADETLDLGASAAKWNNVYAATFQGKATSAQYADLAEMYASDDLYEKGTVVVFGGEYEVTQTDRKGDRRVAGVISTEPAHLMNSGIEAEYPVAVALQGRVPCKVLGKVEKGDLLVSSAVPGYAVVDNDPKVGTIIGKALEDKQDSGKGIIEVVVGRV